MTDAGRTSRPSQGEIAVASLAALTDDELRRWVSKCRTLEADETNEWAEAPARTLVETILSCSFGADVKDVDGPARAWAQSTPTMAVLARRLGSLRELLGQEGAIDDGDAAIRMAAVLDRVTIVTTETGLAELADAGADDPLEDDRALTTRRVSQGIAAAVAVAAMLAVVTTLWPPSHPARPERAAAHHGTTATPASGGPDAAATPGSGVSNRGSGNGSVFTSFRTPALGGPAAGRTVEQTVAAPGSGASGSSGGPGDGSSTSGGVGTTSGTGGLSLPGSVPLPSGLPLLDTSPLAREYRSYAHSS